MARIGTLLGFTGNTEQSGGVSWSGVNATVSGFIFESATTGITAHAGGGQASAVGLTTEVNIVSTVATAGDSVALPASVAGLTIFVLNKGANAMQVYGAGTDTIDAVATATGVSQMANSLVIYTCGAAGAWFSEGLATGYSGSLQTFSSVTGLTAHAGGGQASATLLTAMQNQVTTVASAADSVKLPASAPGMEITVINSAAVNAMQLFGTGTDTINGVASGTGVSVAAGKQAQLSCYTAGAWVGPVALA